MQLTKTQKEVLVRKATIIVNEKREKEKNKLTLEHVISPEGKAKIKGIEKVLKKRDELIKLAKEYGFTCSWSGISTGVYGASVSYYSQDNGDDCDELQKCTNAIAEYEIENILNKKFPCDQNIIDDVELLCFGKDFDVDAFLEKYKSL